jgi:hypothetical protein
MNGAPLAIHGFLSGRTPRSVRLGEPASSGRADLHLGSGGAPQLEVLVARATEKPRSERVRAAWKSYHGHRAAPLVLVVLYGDKCALCGPVGDDPPPHLDLDPGQVERICEEALTAPDRHSAERALRASLESVRQERPGVNNQGFLATHQLFRGVPQRADWSEACTKARPLLDRQDEDLLRGLGFEIAQHLGGTSILRAHGKKVALAVLLRRDEAPELNTARFNNLSPVSHALKVADDENLDWLVVVHGAGRQIRVYPTKISAGVGRRSRSETFVECHTTHLRDTDAGYLWLLCSAEALAPDGSLRSILDESRRFAGALAKDLRDRIYERAVPALAEGLVAARALRRPSATDLAQTYEMAMTALFRLLFIAYAEDKDLLPYRSNGEYQARSLKHKARELCERARNGIAPGEGDALWQEIRALFHAVDRGNPAWGVPAYNGGLFSSDAAISPVGALLESITLPDTVMVEVLQFLLLVDDEHDGLGPVDFRSLGVREFGTVYEGLLESELSVAETDLALDDKGNWRPCGARETPEVRRGEVYLHNRSGARKASGSYFTKEFAVEHLLDKALEPALDEHLERLDALDETDAAKAFFDFRVADIAMGSGHFLVAAVDRIEKRFVDALAKRPLPLVLAELAKLRAAAKKELGPLGDGVDIEDSQLLRRLIARRCIYGVDLNPVSVQLARLAIWIHTFVPGLPLSLLDHNLVQGNSLVGVGRIDEIVRQLEKEKLEGWIGQPSEYLQRASEPLNRMARILDASLADVERARDELKCAAEYVKPLEAICDVLTHARIAGTEMFERPRTTWRTDRSLILQAPEYRNARAALQSLSPFHFPVAFPEVFLRERPGFDVILGNPPWEEATLEQDAFWARHVPGMRSLPQREQEAVKARLRRERPDLVAAYEREVAVADALRAALVSGSYPGMGTGDPDLYKAFCWRFWTLVTDSGGRIGVVLPRSALAAKGSTTFRETVFECADDVDVTLLLNNRQWFFESVHPQYTIGLVALARRRVERTRVALRGPYPSYERYGDGMVREPAVFYGDEIKHWNDTASLPLLPTEASVEVFARLRRSPRLDLDDGTSWRARPHTELHATNDKELMDLTSSERPDNFWPVYKGESFDLWTPDTGTYYAWADPQRVLSELQATRQRGGRSKRSPFSEFDVRWNSDPKTLPCRHARIAFRDVTNRTNQRTVIAALVPPNVLIGNQAPYLLLPRGDACDEAFLLGALSSLSLDWYARRFVETHVNYFVFNPLPVPRPNRTDMRWQRTVALAGRLACPDDRFATWAESVGVESGPLAADEKDDMIHELDAVVALLYGLSERQLVHVFETFHEGWDYDARLRTTLAHFRTWKRRT